MNQDNIRYLIKITNHVNKSERIINQVVTLTTYSSHFNKIVKELIRQDSSMTSSISHGRAELYKTETIIVKGYIYNSKSDVSKVVYELSLIKLDEDFTSLCVNPTVNTNSTQTEQGDIKEERTKEQENQTETPVYVDTETEPEPHLEDSDEFGEFQSAEFTNVDLHYPLSTYQQTYPYYQNTDILVPEYYPYTANNTYTNQNNYYTNYSTNPFTSTNPFIGSNVPSTPTRPAVVNSWAPEMMNELKFRLAQPNAGLNYTNSTNYYL